MFKHKYALLSKIGNIVHNSVNLIFFVQKKMIKLNMIKMDTIETTDIDMRNN